MADTPAETQINHQESVTVPVLEKEEDEVAIVYVDGEVAPEEVPVAVEQLEENLNPIPAYTVEGGDENAAKEDIESSENGSKTEDSPTKNGDKNGFSAENGGELKRKSIGEEARDGDVIAEKKVKLAGEEVGEGEVEAGNGVPAN